jgi:hypothetical protein
VKVFVEADEAFVIYDLSLTDFLVSPAVAVEL